MQLRYAKGRRIVGLRYRRVTVLTSVTRRLLGVHFGPLGGKRLVVHLFWFIYDDMAASVREPEWDAQQVFESHSQFFSSFRRNEEQHETTAARPEQFAPEGAGAAPCLINLV